MIDQAENIPAREQANPANQKTLEKILADYRRRLAAGKVDESGANIVVTCPNTTLVIEDFSEGRRPE